MSNTVSRFNCNVLDWDGEKRRFRVFICRDQAALYLNFLLSKFFLLRSGSFTIPKCPGNQLSGTNPTNSTSKFNSLWIILVWKWGSVCFAWKWQVEMSLCGKLFTSVLQVKSVLLLLEVYSICTSVECVYFSHLCLRGIQQNTICVSLSFN